MKQTPVTDPILEALRMDIKQKAKAALKRATRALPLEQIRRQKAEADFAASEKRIAELEAQCAAMRVALELISAVRTEPIEYMSNDPKNGNYDDSYSAGDDCGEARAFNSCAKLAESHLSGDAGRVLLERMRTLERVAASARKFIDSGDEDRSSEFDAMSSALAALEEKP